jgi:hypothetical protein
VLFRKKAEQLSSRAILKGEKQFFFVLKRVVKFDNERMVHADKDISLSHDMSLLFSFFNIFFLEDLHGIDSIIGIIFFFD